MGKAASPLSKADRELLKTFSGLQRATNGMGDSAGELLKAAALQLVARKLDEVTALLRSIGLTPNYTQASIGLAPSPAANRTDPLATLEAMEQAKYGLNDANGKPKAGVFTGITCQLCGYPAVYKTKRGMTLCLTHRAQGIQDDKDDGVRAMITKGFGNPGGQNEEVIEVPAGTIQAAVAAEDTVEQ